MAYFSMMELYSNWKKTETLDYCRLSNWDNLDNYHIQNLDNSDSWERMADSKNFDCCNLDKNLGIVRKRMKDPDPQTLNQNHHYKSKMTEKKNKKYVYNFSIFKIDKIFEKYLLVDGKVDRLVGKVGRVEPCRVGRYVGRVGKWACKDGMVVDEGVGNNPSNVF